MDAGRLRHLVTFQERVVSLDSDGAQVEEWVPLFGGPISAEITPLSGRELIAAQSVQSKVTGRMCVRYRPGLTATMRAVHRGVIYNITAVIADPESGAEYVTLLTSTGSDEG